MGLTYAEINLSNPRNSDLSGTKIKALVDTGALLICIPQHIAIQLNLEELEKREVYTADGKMHSVPYVGPLKIQFENRFCFVGALVLGDEPLLGAVPMEDMDVMVHPSIQKLIVNPANPNMPAYPVK
ncbi:MAG: clan AA aspartic protease [Bacteroidota bacterium]|nr:clan AA aspartic protease [Bacteroidota bacterium]